MPFESDPTTVVNVTLASGAPVIVAGPNITVNTASNGSVEITGSAGGIQPEYWTSSTPNLIDTTGSVNIDGSTTAVLGFSGSLTTLADGSPYLLAGPYITINSSSNGAIQISSSYVDVDPTYWFSNAPNNIFTTGSIDLTGSLVASGSIRALTGFTGSLLGTASYASQAATASYVLQAVSASYASYAVTASQAGVATNALNANTASYVLQAVSASYASYAVTASQAGVATNALNANTASYLVDTGFSGSLTRLKDGTPYLLAGPNITLVTSSNGSIQISSSQPDIDPIYWTSNVSGNIFTTGSVDITGSLVASGSIRTLTGFTGSLLGTASYAAQASTASYVLQAVSASYASYALTASQAGVATNALNANTASYVLQAVSASYSSYAVTASQAGVATNALNANTASYLVDTGFSGSITKLKDGAPYLLAGPNVTITTNSNGSIAISSSQAVLDSIYWISNAAGNIFTTGSVDITGSLFASGSIRALTGFTGSLLGTASYASQAATASYVLQAISASYASYAVTASQAGVATNALNANTASYLVDTGFSGSLTRLKDGTNYLLAGPNITVTTNSNGAVAISASLAGVVNYWQSNVAGNVFATGSVDITGSLYSSGSITSRTGFTGSLLGTASYAAQAATASYVLQALSSSYASYAVTASQAGVATNALNANTASYLVDTGFSGSITKLKDGTNYLLAGPNITITTNSNGSVAITGSAGSSSPSYWISNISGNIFTTGSADITGSLVASGSIRSLTGFTGSLLGTASYAAQAATASYVLQAVSASYAYTASLAGVATSSLNANTASYLVDTGFSGSLTRLKDGTSYLLAGPNVTITTNSNGSIAISGSASVSSPAYWLSNVAGNIFTTGSVDITGSLVASGSIRALTGFTGSLLGTASYASQAATASYVLQAVSSSYAYTASLAGVATSSLNANTASYLVDTGFSGSLTRLKDGTNYLLAGPNITITTSSNGSIQISGSYIDIDPIYWVSNAAGNIFTTGSVDITGSLISSGSIRALTGFTGSLLGTASYASQAATASYVLQAVSASYAYTASFAGVATSSLNANTASYLVDAGFSGSLTKLKDGTDYLLAGPNITITTSSNGSVQISGSYVDIDPVYWTSNVAGNIFTTGSVDITGSLVASGSIRALTGFTGSLLGTASYASQAATASYVLQAVSSSYAYTASLAGVATSSLNANTASYLVDTGFSGSLTRLKDGTQYLLAGPNITVTTNSNGSIAISGSAAASSPSYWVSNSTANIFTTGSVDITGSLVSSGSIKALTGFSGSHTKLTDGTNYLLAGPNVTITTNSNGAIAISASLAGATNYWQSDIAGNIFTTGSVDITGSLVSSGSIRTLTGFTGSLLGTASYAAQAATASYVLQAVSSSYAYTASLAGIATSSLNANTASYLVDAGFSGSLTRLKDGTLYLIAGPNITITTNSNGSVAVSGSATTSSPSYWTSNVAANIFATGSVDITGSLYSSGSITTRTGFTGSLLGTASFAAQASTASYVLQAVSASYASYAVTASQAGVATNALNANTASYLVDTGFSGSITKLKDGTSYLLAGPNITITTNSNGAVAISASLASATNYWQSIVAGNVFNTGSVDITGSLYSSGSIISRTGFTGSLLGTASYASQAATASYVLQAVSSSYAYTASLAGIATSSLNANTASYLVDTGFSGSLTRLKDGTLYLIAGPNVTITTNSNGSVAITGSASTASPIYWTSNAADNIFTTGSVDITGSLYSSGSIISRTGFTGSLFGTASYATQAATASYVLQAVSASYAYTASLAGVATSSLNANTASYLVDTGFSGSITKLKDGTLYLLAGPNVTITTNSNGSVAISGSAAATTPSYWISNVSANIFATGSVDITGSLVVSGSIKAFTGFSGSLTKLTDGTPYLLAGANITINSSSNGAIQITGSVGGSSPSYWFSNVAGNTFTTGSADLTGSLYSSGSITARTGLSGSLTKLADGTSYLIAGTNVTISSASNGAITINATSGPGGTANTGSTSLNFGSAPGTNIVSASVTGQTSIVAGSQINAWIAASTTATHNMTEHLVAPIVVKCGPATVGTGFTIYAYSQIRMTGIFTVQWFWN